MRQEFLIIFLLLSLLLSFSFPISENGSIAKEKINGVNFVAPANRIPKNAFLSLDRIGANWVAITPYAYTPKNSPNVIFYQDHPKWWGEGISGAITQIEYAKSLGFRVMLKPHVWVLGEGWPGDFELLTESDWREWERDYRMYLLTLSDVAEKLEVELFCIGTEYCKAAVLRPIFWKDLIAEIREKYSGKITYAANWDNYKNISFWNSLDYIGIDAYFPLSEKRTPDISELNLKWRHRKNDLASFSKALHKSILFTEYGYRSSDYCAKAPWEESNHQINIDGQRNAYEALYQSIWGEKWMAGGFLWKWYSGDSKSGGKENVHFTPQNKPTEKIIRNYYCN